MISIVKNLRMAEASVQFPSMELHNLKRSLAEHKASNQADGSRCNATDIRNNGFNMFLRSLPETPPKKFHSSLYDEARNGFPKTISISDSCSLNGQVVVAKWNKETFLPYQPYLAFPGTAFCFSLFSFFIHTNKFFFASPLFSEEFSLERFTTDGSLARSQQATISSVRCRRWN
jgi:hypothetical protein